MGYAIAMSPCVRCRQLFAYNPLRVPSISIAGGPREPICAACVEAVNPARRANGLPPIVPLPDAYEPVDESELP